MFNKVDGKFQISSPAILMKINDDSFTSRESFFCGGIEIIIIYFTARRQWVEMRFIQWNFANKHNFEAPVAGCWEIVRDITAEKNQFNSLHAFAPRAVQFFHTHIFVY